jgi:P4 family phage/plasmid primase-like protien
MSSIYNEFLQEHKTNEKIGVTHTRIGDRDLEIYGWKGIINNDELLKFYSLYCNHINSKNEYLTEVQNRTQGPIVVDLDFRYNKSINERKHTGDHGIDIIQIYCDNIIKLTDLKKCKFSVYLLEKDQYIELEDKIKDGIHIQFTLSMDRTLQLLLRKEVLKDINDVFESLPLINSYEEVIDEGVCSGITNWQLLGSRKPGNIPYKVTKHYSISIDDDGDYNIIDEKVKTEYDEEFIYELSVKNVSHKLLTVCDEYKYLYDEMIIRKTTKNNSIISKSIKAKSIVNGRIDYSQIDTIAELDFCIERYLGNIDHEDYLFKEVFDYTMVLPDEYYNDFNKWIRVGWALKNTSDDLFLCWIKFSSQSDKFSFSDIPKLLYDWQEKWNFEDNDIKYSGGVGFTFRSLIFWAKNYNYEKYKLIQRQSMDYYIEQTLFNNNEYDLAVVVYQMYKGTHVCVSVAKNTWYEYKNHRWAESDSAHNLRLNMSRKISKIYKEKAHVQATGLNNLTVNPQVSNYQEPIMNRINDNNTKDKKEKDKHDRVQGFGDISNKLKQTTPKNNIMREAACLFYDDDFFIKLNNNPYLLGCKNGVYDFSEKQFRNGCPEDFISLSTNINYIKFNNTNPEHIQIKKEIDDFMTQLFPVQELREYMWEHLASCLLGTIENQTFNIYLGGGRNGKSKLVELMSLVLGDYKGTVPITLITQKRNSIGSASPEIAQLLGKRYAVMQEPTKGDKINEGIMKEITGGDPLQGRSLFKDTITFVPQFKLVVCTNNLFDINSNDDGTWRRIRVCDFMSKFTETPETTVDKPYVYKVDKNIDKKFKEWKCIFLSLLIDIAQKTMGNVKDCNLVLSAMNKYRKGQDHLTEFFDECIVKRDGCKLKKTEVQEEFKTWYQQNRGKNAPPGKDLFDYLDNKLGVNINNKWIGYTLKEDDEIEEEEIN